ncbi:MAG: DUF2288 domain-containing protein [Gammaproteobacteria bacterium]|nr:DUF2288 domain-containing protein [Gammaproteobacteria bacterium]
MKEDLEQLTARLNTETAHISWTELERHFARGDLMTVSSSIDLVLVGAHMIHDDKTVINAWLETGELRKTTDDDARGWSEGEPVLWAVVVAPWVLVQERGLQPKKA